MARRAIPMIANSYLAPVSGRLYMYILSLHVAPGDFKSNLKIEFPSTATVRKLLLTAIRVI